MGQSKYVVLSENPVFKLNYSVARDFVEAPSQMLENWCSIDSSSSVISRPDPCFTNQVLGTKSSGADVKPL